ncbi:MAG: neutral/alkaline non-lysosomal ceramidase N-terminal domain-containing protein [Planctomycetes bacterium]|nr:neutral/alkaline non-lysosomal ceramidase N-terminal domain-containing protein [Planctomycetota bacterium]MCB9886264.1 neutral/alkaline non-lysosomal ceramidase N-terminal domain-containing protein [Planctomycetota bacterium]
MTRLLRVSGALLLGALGGCAGIFQHHMPAVPASYAVQSPVAPAQLRVGSAERDITPEVGGYMAGFSIARTSTAISTPLKLRALVIDTPSRRIAIVGIDNLGVMRQDADWLKGGVAGFANGDVFLCASHTHAGPDLIGLWGYYGFSTGRDPAYLTKLHDALRQAVAEALASAVPAHFEFGQTRLPPAGLVKNSNRGGVFDRRLSVLTAKADDDGRPVGTLLHMACHPEVLSRRNSLISADFVGALCEQWRARGHGQAVFVNGALGAMVSPDWRERDPDGVAAFGAVACDLAEQALTEAAPLPVDAIEVRRRDVYLPLDTMLFRLGRLFTVLPRELYSGNARSSVGYLRLGALEAIAVPGEMEPAMAAQLRRELGKPDVLLFGLCDDEVGYLLRDRDAHDPEFAYERSMSPCTDAGERVRRAISGVGYPR